MGALLPMGPKVMKERSLKESQSRLTDLVLLQLELRARLKWVERALVTAEREVEEKLIPHIADTEALRLDARADEVVAEPVVASTAPVEPAARVTEEIGDSIANTLATVIMASSTPLSREEIYAKLAAQGSNLTRNQVIGNLRSMSRMVSRRIRLNDDGTYEYLRPAPDPRIARWDQT